MNYNHSDPTANAALGAFDRELRNARKQGQRLRALRLSGHLTYEEERRTLDRLKGVFRRAAEEEMAG